MQKYINFNIYVLIFVAAVGADLLGDAKILEKCLVEMSTNDNLQEHLQTLANYSNWTAEELPCLMRCIVESKGWFDIERNKWHKQRLADELGTDMYNYCRYELNRRYNNGCTFAYRGFRCLKQAELHTSMTYLTLLQCAKQLNASNEQLLEYTKLHGKEHIPCLFECFAQKMQFYYANGNWQLDNWIKAFGPIKYENTDFTKCRLADAQRQAVDKCVWMYQEYVCWEQANELSNTTTSDVLTTTTARAATTFNNMSN